MLDQISEEDCKPKCPKCEGVEFVAIRYEGLKNSEKPVALVVCEDETCRTVISALPADAVWY